MEQGRLGVGGVPGQMLRTPHHLRSMAGAAAAMASSSVLTTTRLTRALARAAWTLRPTSETPSTSCRFLPGMPFDPPRAGIKARSRRQRSPSSERIRCAPSYPMIDRLGVPETGMLAHRTLPALMAPAQLLPGRSRDVDATAGLGRRPSASTCGAARPASGLPVWHLEDGLPSLAGQGPSPPTALPAGG